jgi:hypothetical protein
MRENKMNRRRIAIFGILVLVSLLMGCKSESIWGGHIYSKDDQKTTTNETPQEDHYIGSTETHTCNFQDINCSILKEMIFSERFPGITCTYIYYDYYSLGRIINHTGFYIQPVKGEDVLETARDEYQKRCIIIKK